MLRWLNLRRGYWLNWLRCRRCRFFAASRDRRALRRDRECVRNRCLRQNRGGPLGWIGRFDGRILSAPFLRFHKGVPHPSLRCGWNVTRRNCGRLLTAYSLRGFGTRRPFSCLSDVRIRRSFGGNCAMLREVRIFQNFRRFREKRIAHRKILCAR